MKKIILLLVALLLPIAGQARVQAYLQWKSVPAGDDVVLYVGDDTGGTKYSVSVHNTNDNVPLFKYSGITLRSQTLLGTENVDRWEYDQSFVTPLKIETTGLAQGIYELRVETNSGVDAADRLHFVVRPAAGTEGTLSKVLFVTYDATNMAYDAWGGKSSYTGAKFVTMHRPNGDTMNSPGTNDFRQWYTMPDEMSIARWFAYIGMPVEYASQFDLDSTLDPADYKIIVILGHSEYWSEAQRVFIEAVLTAGGRLISLSGNTMWWQTRIDADDLFGMHIHKGSAPATDPTSTTCSLPNTPYGCLGVLDDTLLTNNWITGTSDPETDLLGIGWTDNGGGGYSNNGTGASCNAGGVEDCFSYLQGYGQFFINQCADDMFDGTGVTDNPEVTANDSALFDISDYEGGGVWTGGLASQTHFIGYNYGGAGILGYEVDGCSVTMTGSPSKPVCSGTDGEAAFNILAWAPSYQVPYSETRTMMGTYVPAVGGEVFNGGSTRFFRAVASRSTSAPQDKRVYKLLLNVFKEYGTSVGEWGALSAAMTNDFDGDGIADIDDNCIETDNGPTQGPNNQLDTDGDGTGDVCDAFPSVANQCI